MSKFQQYKSKNFHSLGKVSRGLGFIVSFILLFASISSIPFSSFWTVAPVPSSEAKLFGPATGNGSLYQTETCVINPDANGVPDYQIADWKQTCKVKKFDPLYGELKKVTVGITVNVKADFKIENKSATPTTFDVSDKAMVTVLDLVSGNTLAYTEPSVVKNYTMPRYDGILDFGGTSGKSDTDLIALEETVTNSYVNSNPAHIGIINSFITSSGTVNPDKQVIVDTKNNAGISPGDRTTDITTYTKIKLLTFTYEYYQPDLSIKKSHTPVTPNVGSQATINLEVRNEDTEPTTKEITVTDNLPSYLSLVSQSNADWTCTSAVVCKTNKILAPGASSIVSLLVNVGASAPASFNNVADLTYPISEYNTTNNRSTDLMNFNHPPIAVDCDTLARQQGIKYNILAAKNPCLTGTDPDANDSVVKYEITGLPDSTKGVLYYSTSSNGTDNGIAVQIGDDVTGKLDKLVFVPKDGFIGNYDFSYTVYDSFGLKDLTPATVVGTYYENDISLDKVSVGGKPFTILTDQKYTLTVKNEKSTPVTANEFVVEDTLPPELDYVNAVGTDWNCNYTLATKYLKCIRTKAFAANEVSTVTVDVKVKDVTVDRITNTGTISTDAKELKVTNNTDTDVTSLSKPPVAYDCDLGKMQQGTNVVMKDKISNCLKGTDPDVGDVITKFIIKTLPDPLKGKLTLNGVDVVVGQVILPGQENNILFVPKLSFVGTFEYTYTVEDNHGSQDSTPAKVIGEYYGNDLKITKTLLEGTSAVIVPNKPYTYEVKVSNTKTTDVSGQVTMIESLPESLSFVENTAPAGWTCSVGGIVLTVVTCTSNKLWTAGQVDTFVFKTQSKAVVTSIIKNTAEIKPEFPESDLVNDLAMAENPGSNPPIAYDCDLGKSPMGDNFIIDEKVLSCLKGTDPDTGDSITKFTIKTLPDPAKGKLVLNGVDVVVGQIITPGQENKLTFVPFGTYVGNYSFTYTVEDTKGLFDETPATVIGLIYENDIKVDKELSNYDKFVIGQPAVYKIKVYNAKDTPLKAKTTMVDTLPSDLEYVSVVTPNTDWVCTFSIPKLTCEYNKIINPNEVFNFTVNTKIKGLTNTKNKVEVGGSYKEMFLSNNVDEIDMPPLEGYDIGVIKSHEGTFEPGKTGVYNITVMNNKKTKHDNAIEMTDTLPDGLIGQSFTAPTGWICEFRSNAKVLYCIADAGLSASEKSTIKLVVQIATAAPDNLENKVEVKTNPPETEYVNNKAIDTVKLSKASTARTGGDNNTSSIITAVLLGVLAVGTFVWSKRKS
jgi:uncharacterized repeat protein (TIGR01451 family)